jgi:zinc protease
MALAGIIAVTVQAGGAHAQSAGGTDTVRHFRLENGLQAVVAEDRRAPVVTHMIYYGIGSADDPPGKSGLAHFLEHLMFKGTANHPPGEFSARIAAVGGRENAFTSRDNTAYFQQVHPSVLAEMMAFEADRMRNLRIAESDVRTERDVVLTERGVRVENRPEGLFGEAMTATLYMNHPYRNPVIGWQHEIHDLALDDVLNHYRRHYAPENAVLVVVGDVEAETVRSLAEATYGTVAAGPQEMVRTRPREPEHHVRRTVTLTDPRVSTGSLRTAWVVPSYRTARPGEAEALDVLAEILGGGMYGRFHRHLVVEQGIAARAGAYFWGGARDETEFVVHGAPRGEAGVTELKRAMSEVIAKVAAEGVDPDELERARKRLVREFIFSRDSQSGTARLYGSMLTAGHTIEDIESWPARILKVSEAEIRAAVRRFLDPDRAVTGYLMPVPEDTGGEP